MTEEVLKLRDKRINFSINCAEALVIFKEQNEIGPLTYII